MYMLLNQNKMKNKIPQCQNNSKIPQKNTTMSEQFQNPTEKSLEKVKMIPNTRVNDHSLFELGTGASIKSVGLN